MRLIKLFLLLVVFYIYKEIFQYSHPVENRAYNIFFSISFFIGFIPFLFNERFGRISILVSSISLTRFAPISGISDNLICNFPILIGGIFALQLKNESKLEYSNILMLLLFLNFLLLERFFIYFNFPYLNGYSLQETMFNSEISSKTAFSISTEIIYSFYFPIFLIYSDKNRNKKDLILGIFYLVCFNLLILSIQKFIEPNFFMKQSNLSLEVARQPALFRDSSSSSVILSLSFFFLLFNLKEIFPDLEYSKKFITENKSMSLFLIFFFTFLFTLIFFTQGRTSLFVLFIGFAFLYFKNKKNIKKKFHLLIFIFFLIAFVFIINKLNKPEIKNKYNTAKIESLEDFLLYIDPPRLYLNLISIELFLDKPIFGNGMGSFIVELKDATRNKSNPYDLIDNPGSFYTGIFYEIGILGVIFIFLNLGKKILSKEMFLVIPILLIGYQFVHPDISFFLLLFIFGLRDEDTKVNLKFYFSILIFLVLITNLIFKFYYRENLFEFKKTNTKKFQLSQYSEANNYYIFKGNLSWKTDEKKEYRIEIFLDQTTKRKNINLEVKFLNSKKKLIYKEILNVEKETKFSKVFILNENSNSIELNEIFRFGDFTPYAIQKIYFNEKNEFLSR